MPQDRADVPARHRVERTCDQLRIRNRLFFVAHPAGALVNAPDSSRRIGDPGVNVEAHQRDPVATGLVVFGTQVDRHRQMQIEHADAVFVVVAAQAAGHPPRDERVVERATAAVGGFTQSRHRNIEHAEFANQRAVRHQRRARLVDRPDGPVHRRGQLARGFNGLPGAVE